MHALVYFLTSLLSLTFWAFATKASSFRDVAVILGGSQTSVEIYTGRERRGEGGICPPDICEKNASFFKLKSL
jgi:hypothetical protein